MQLSFVLSYEMYQHYFDTQEKPYDLCIDLSCPTPVEYKHSHVFTKGALHHSRPERIASESLNLIASCR